MRTRLSVAVVIACVLSAASAVAATVEPTQGNVLINRGSGYRPFSAPVNGQAGDSVMAKRGGSAIITYDDGCKFTVEPGTVVTIASKSPCSQTALAFPHFAVGAAVVGGGVGAVILLNDDDEPASP